MSWLPISNMTTPREVSRFAFTRRSQDWFRSAVSLIVFSIAAAMCTTTQAEQGQQLVIYCWPGYVPESITELFAEETGIQVIRQYFSTNEELLQRRLNDGIYDLVQPSDYAAEALIHRDALQPLRLDRIPNVKNLDPEFRKLPHDPDGEYTVPWLAGTVGIVVNTSKVKEPIGSYGDVFSGKYEGRIVALSDPREWLGWALMHLGIPVNEVTPEVLTEVRQVWSDWMPQIAVFDSDTAADVMIDGAADIALTWSGDAATLLAKSSRYKYILPSAGAHRYVDCLAIPKGAPHREAAEEFINFILRPDVSLMLSAEIPFTNPNAAAFEKLSKRAKSNPASYPPEDANLKSFRSIGEMFDQVEKVFNDVRFGTR